MKTCFLTIEVQYDETATDPEAIASAADTLLETALSTPGILDEYGNPTFDEFYVASHFARVPSRALCAFLEAEIHNCTAPNGSGEPTTLLTANGSLAQMPDDVLAEVIDDSTVTGEMLAAELRFFQDTFGDDAEMQPVIDLA